MCEYNIRGLTLKPEPWWWGSGGGQRRDGVWVHAGWERESWKYNTKQNIWWSLGCLEMWWNTLWTLLKLWRKQKKFVKAYAYNQDHIFKSSRSWRSTNFKYWLKKLHYMHLCRSGQGSYISWLIKRLLITNQNQVTVSCGLISCINMYINCHNLLKTLICNSFIRIYTQM